MTTRRGMDSVSLVEPLLKKIPLSTKSPSERPLTVPLSFKGLSSHRERVRFWYLSSSSTYRTYFQLMPEWEGLMATGVVTTHESKPLKMVRHVKARSAIPANTCLFLATKKIQNIANVLRLSEVVVLAARRMYTLAVEHKFTKGRKSLNVVAVCLYVACRQKETRNYMLIDFSDLLQARTILGFFLARISPFNI